MALNKLSALRSSMDVLWQNLVQFIFRLTFGIAWAMTITPSQHVTSGFFRVHLWVLMGLNTFAALAITTASSGEPGQTALLVTAITLAVASYLGSVVWLYESPRTGTALLAIISCGALVGGVLVDHRPGLIVSGIDTITAGLLLGSTTAAMLLGHWYLNTPTMDLVPLRRLLHLMFAAVIVRTIVALAGLALAGGDANVTFWLFVSLRWLAGLVGTGVMAVLAYRTLRIPNTQSATGILYAAVILAFIGELMSQLLSQRGSLL